MKDADPKSENFQEPSLVDQDAHQSHIPLGWRLQRALVGVSALAASGIIFYTTKDLVSVDPKDWLQMWLIPPEFFIGCAIALEVLDRMVIVREHPED
jgi:hypothetical protein